MSVPSFIWCPIPLSKDVLPEFARNPYRRTVSCQLQTTLFDASWGLYLVSLGFDASIQGLESRLQWILYLQQPVNFDQIPCGCFIPHLFKVLGKLRPALRSCQQKHRFWRTRWSKYTSEVPVQRGLLGLWHLVLLADGNGSSPRHWRKMQRLELHWNCMTWIYRQPFWYWLGSKLQYHDHSWSLVINDVQSLLPSLQHLI